MVAKGTKNLGAYLRIMQAREYANQYNKESNVLARQLAEEAITVDPGYAFAYASLAYTHFMDVLLGASKNRVESIERGIELAQKAIAMDEFLERPHGILSLLYILKKEYDKAILEAERGLALEPNSALAFHAVGTALLEASRYEEAIPFFKKAMRFSPIPWSITLMNMASSYRMTGQYEEALIIGRRLVQSHPDHVLGHLGLAATYSFMGRMEEARAEAAEVLRIDPKFSLESENRLLYKNKADSDRIMDALRKAGLK
jgi:tetratricopeptide (TPR) repeat protein